MPFVGSVPGVPDKAICHTWITSLPPGPGDLVLKDNEFTCAALNKNPPISGRSLKLREVSAGGRNACESDECTEHDRL
jgi:hypothetical protein